MRAVAPAIVLLGALTSVGAGALLPGPSEAPVDRLPIGAQVPSRRLSCGSGPGIPGDGD